ncbi:MAG TPA: alcohol dehydrogenase catalytic domain-containing protein [Acidimicrobiales bacterium]|jgi:threonine dehydrogenase-like Zn-dependent dehydrogenase|nr:alcohol dehydrogenase catalytic domain-containing protein [Acidimicrobiales bacterium]
MKALVFGLAPDAAEQSEPTDDLDRRLASLPFGLHEVDEAKLVRPDWVITRPLLSGVCGSETKLVLGDFDTGDIDNPMAAFSSIPHIPGHEVVAEVVRLGPEAKGLEVGQRVLLNPWLTCGPRGIDPPCPPCRAGDLNLCWSFTSGALGPGVHLGVATDAPGGWADRMAAHDSMLIPVPDSVSDEVAVLADPFAVSLHAIVRHPPPPGGKALVYGAGALGVTSVAVLRALYPDVQIAVVARFAAQAALATAFGAQLVLEHEPRLELVEALADWSGGVLHTAYDGLPMAHPGGVDVIYDTVARPETLEVGVRLLAERGTLVQTGVHTPGRWEYTPIYFKELSLVGSNAFGMEEVEGVRQHAIRHYLDLVVAGRVDLTGMLTHQFPLDHWHDALRALAAQDVSGAVKVAFGPASQN